MKIEASATLDFEAIRTLVHLSMYKKKKPKNRMILSGILFSLLLLVILFEMFYFGYNTTFLILLALTLTMLGLRLFLYFGLPKKQYEAMGNMQNAVNLTSLTTKLSPLKPSPINTTVKRLLIILHSLRLTKLKNTSFSIR